MRKAADHRRHAHFMRNAQQSVLWRICSGKINSILHCNEQLCAFGMHNTTLDFVSQNLKKKKKLTSKAEENIFGQGQSLR